MATDKEFRSVLAPVLSRHPDWRYSRGWLFRLPIGYYLRGIAFKSSWSSRESYQISRCVYPMYEFVPHVHTGWSMSYPIPGTTNHGWNVFHPHFVKALVDVMDQGIVPLVAHIEKGSDFLRYLTENYTMHGWQDVGKALAHIHMGDLESARDLLIRTAEQFQLPHLQRLKEPDAWGHNLLEMLRLIEEDPAAIPAHCEAVARQSAKLNKLEKFWEPVPFVYETPGS